MAESETGQIQWHRPDPTAITPLESVKIPRSLRQVLRKNLFTVTVNRCFDRVIRACAAREETWISEDIVDAYETLHFLGHAHSVETWCNNNLVGGLYGVSIHGAFFGESMFSTHSNASKVAFAHLIHLLLSRGYVLLDTQYINNFTESLGAVEVSDAVYQQILRLAMARDVRFD